MLTYGFYNSKNHDRVYDAIQMSSIFDGIIGDGVYMSIGDHFLVTPDSGMTVLVGTGRAWFNHTWTLNDAIIPLTIPTSEVILNRIDAVVLEVNADPNVRENSIKVIKGTPATNPIRPAMSNTGNVHWHPLAYIEVNAGASSIRAADISVVVGTSETPWVTGIIDTISIDYLLEQWKDQWKRFYEQQTEEMEETNDYWNAQWNAWYATLTKDMKDSYALWEQEWEDWFNEYQTEMNETSDHWKELWNAWFYSYVNENQTNINAWYEQEQFRFEEWFHALQVSLDENTAANLASEIALLDGRVDDLENFTDELRKDGRFLFSYMEAKKEDGTREKIYTDQNKIIEFACRIVTATDQTEVENEVDDLTNQVNTLSTQLNALISNMDNMKAEILLAAYPIGSIYYSMDGANPGTKFGGTWNYIGAGKTIMGVDTNDTDFNAAGKTGGSKSHTHDISHTHTVPAHSHTLNNHTHTAAAHSHTLNNHTHSGMNHTHDQDPHLHADGDLRALIDPAAQGGMSFKFVRSGITQGISGRRLLLQNVSPDTTDPFYDTINTVDIDGYTGNSYANIKYSGNMTTGGPSNNATSSAGNLATGGPSNNATSTKEAVNTGNPSKQRSDAGNNLSPYITCYIWQRVA